MDAERYREQSRERWERAAPGWARRQGMLRSASAAVSQWLVQAVAPAPGDRILDLAAGVGETGFLAAGLISPGGTLICSDQSERMLAAARARAAELGLANVEFKLLDAEWIDLPLASVDAVLCRWGYMLMADPGAALRETRRVLRPGGRLALAVWDVPDVNPWVTAPAQELRVRGWLEAPPEDHPGMFALADRERLQELIEAAGLTDVEIATLDFWQRFETVDEWWATQLDLSVPFREAVEGRAQEELAEVREALRVRVAKFTAASDGALRLPARALVAAARG